MATTAQPITIDEYLHTSYEPDCDYIDGEIQERHLGEFDHGKMQIALGVWFATHEKQWNVHTISEMRIRVTPNRVRIADLCLISRSEPVEQVAVRLPLVAIEILSPEDRVSRYEQRIDDYRAMGIRHIWIVDPLTRRGYDCSTGSWIERRLFVVEKSPITLDLSAIFAELS